MATKTDRILGYLPRTFQTSPRPPVLYPVVDTFGRELLAAENSLSAVMLSHWVDFADKGTFTIDDLRRIAALYGLAPRDDESVEEFREHLKHYVKTFLEGTVTVQGTLRITAEVLGLHIADANEDLDGWWRRDGNELITMENRGDDAAEKVFGFGAARAMGNAALPAQVKGSVPLAGVNLPDSPILHISVDGKATDVKLPAGPADPDAVVKAINTATGQSVAQMEGAFLVLTSPTLGAVSQLEILERPSQAAVLILGLTPRSYQGRDALGAVIIGQTDLSSGVDLSQNRYLRVSIDGQPPLEIDCADPHAPAATSLDFVRDAMNSGMGAAVASHDGKHLILRSPTQGFQSSIALQAAAAQDATNALFGAVARVQSGRGAGPARVVGSRDLSQGIDLSSASNIRLTIDGTTHTIDCAGVDAAKTQTLEVVTAINTAFAAQVASPDGTGIAVTSRTTGPASTLAFGTPASGDATEAIFGITPWLFKGSEATAARIIGNQDLGDGFRGLDLTAQYFLSLAIDGGAPFTINLRAQASDVRAVNAAQVVGAINQAVSSGIASTDGHHVVLTSPTSGAASSLEIKPLERPRRRRFVTRARVTDEAAQLVFGSVYAQAAGTPARTAELVGTCDLSYGVDLRDGSVLRVTVDEGPATEIDCSGARPRATQLQEIVAAINAKLPNVADSDTKHLILRSPSAGGSSRILIEPPTISDASDALPLLGFSPAKAGGTDATRVTFTGLADLSSGVDLAANAAISLDVDGDQHEINLAPSGAVHRSAGEIATLINIEFKSNVCIASGPRLVLSSSKKGAQSKIGLKKPAGSDATSLIFGISPERSYQGQDARAANLASSAVDLSRTVDLSAGRLLRVSVNGAPPQDIDCSTHSADPSKSTLAEIVKSINEAPHDAGIPWVIASPSADAKHLVLTSPTAGFSSTVEIEARPAGDASQKLLGALDPVAQGQDPGPAIIRGTISVTGPVDLSKRSVIRLAVNGERPVDIDVAGLFPSATSIDEVVAAINRVFFNMAAITADDKLQLTAPTVRGGSDIGLLPLRYLEVVEYPPQEHTEPPISVHSGSKVSLMNEGAADSSLEIRLTANSAVADPTFVNLASATSVCIHSALKSGDTAFLSLQQESGAHAEIVSADGKRRVVGADQVRGGRLSSSVIVPFQEERSLTRDSRGEESLQLEDPLSPNVVILRARRELAESAIQISVTEADPSSGSSPATRRWVGRMRATSTGFDLVDGTSQVVAHLQPGPDIRLGPHRNQVVRIVGSSRGGIPPTVIADSLTRLFDVELHLEDGSVPDEQYKSVTIGAGCDNDSLSVRINAGEIFGGFSKLVKAEEFHRGDDLVLPLGKSDWIYLECDGPRYDEASFYDAAAAAGSGDADIKYRFAGKFCEQAGVFNVSRYCQHGKKREDSPSPLYGPIAASSSSSAQLTASWGNYQPGSFAVNLPVDLDERFGARYNRSYYASKKNPAELFAGVVAEPEGDTNNLVKRIKALPSAFVTANIVERVPLGWSGIQMPFRRPQPLTRNPGDDHARIYLTEEGLNGAIEVTAINAGSWGDHISVNARQSGPAIYDVSLFFAGARYENARQLVQGPLPALGTELSNPAPIGVLQAKAAGVLAGVTRDGTERVADREDDAPLVLPPLSYLQFDGEHSYVEVANNQAFSISAQGLTVSAWMRPDTLKFEHVDGSGYVHWLGIGEGSGSTGQQEWAFRMYSEGNSEKRENRISFYLFNLEGGEGVGSYFQEPVTPGQWIHIVGVADTQNTYIYKNGVFKKCDQYSASGSGDCERHPEAIQPQHGTAPLRMGHRDGKSFLLGALKKVRIWNRPLTTQEVADLYARDTVPESGLIAEYRMDEGTGDVVHDSVGGNDGKILGAVWKSE